MRNPVDRVERIYFNWLAAGVGGVLLLTLMIWGPLTALHKWQERHLVRRAAAYLSGGDRKTASINARRAFQLDPHSAGAARVLAQIAEGTADGTEVDWRRKVLELQPGSVDDGLALVRAELRANQLAAAEKTLQSFAAVGGRIPAYHAAWGRLAEMRKNLAEAERSWARAVELAPTNAGFRMQLAMVRLASADSAKREAGRTMLEGLRADLGQRAAATRALIVDGATHHADAQRLADLAKELQSYPDNTFADRILYAEILRQLHDPAYAACAADLAKEAIRKPADLANLLTWMNSNGQLTEAMKLIGQIPPESLTKWPVPLAIAEAYAKTSDWAGLRQLAARGEWNGFDFLRHAYLTRAARAEHDDLIASEEWAQAQKLAASKPQPLLMLSRTVAAWGWEAETVDLLWAVSKNPALRPEALQELYQHYATRGDTAGLYRVLVRSAEVAPGDLTVQNNLAQISLLLGADTDRARKSAAELARKEPGNAAYVSTYAFALYTQGEFEDALDALRRLPDEQLRMPSIAAYYAIVLSAAGEKEKARVYLELSRDAFLLPEEKALIAKATNAVQ